MFGGQYPIQITIPHHSMTRSGILKENISTKKTYCPLSASSRSDGQKNLPPSITTAVILANQKKDWAHSYALQNTREIRLAQSCKSDSTNFQVDHTTTVMHTNSINAAT